VVYQEVKLDCGYRLDLLVEEAVIVEVKTVDRLAPIH
jgi:GxxExxY protein